MLSGHDPGREGRVTPPKAKVMIRVIRGMLANLRCMSPSHAGMPLNLLRGGCHILRLYDTNNKERDESLLTTYRLKKRGL